MALKKLKRRARIIRYVHYKETLVNNRELVLSFLGSFIGIGTIALLQSLQFTEIENIFLIGSFGASSVLVYGSINSPLAQPRNLVGGHVFSAIVGVSIEMLLPNIFWLAAPLAVSLAIVIMQYTKTLHPPGGATALIAVMGTEKIEELGYWYVLSPVLSGCLILLVVAIVFNNLSYSRKYPNKGRLAKLLGIR